MPEIALLFLPSLSITVVAAVVLLLLLRRWPLDRRPRAASLAWLVFTAAATAAMALIPDSPPSPRKVSADGGSWIIGAFLFLILGTFPAAIVRMTRRESWPRSFGFAITAAGVGTVAGLGMTAWFAIFLTVGLTGDPMQWIVLVFPNGYTACAIVTLVSVWRGAPDRPTAAREPSSSERSDRRLTRGQTVALSTCLIAGFLWLTGGSSVGEFYFSRSVPGRLTRLVAAVLMALAALELTRHRRKAAAYGLAAFCLPVVVGYGGSRTWTFNTMTAIAIFAIVCNWRTLK